MKRYNSPVDWFGCAVFFGICVLIGAFIVYPIFWGD